MNANELQIGNWIELKNSGFIKIEADNIGDIVNNEAIFEPIPLTPEILKKCGFVKKWLDNGDTIRCWDYELNEFHLHVLGDDMITFMTRKINYVHQLQNLYFALTGGELNIQL